MQPSEALEFEYAKRLRQSSREERKTLYGEAYSAVSKLRMATFRSEKPEDRTAGTSDQLVKMLAGICRQQDRILEIGCGRGYTCWKLAPHVREIIGTDVSEPSLCEAMELLRRNSIQNASVRKLTADELSGNFEPGSFDKAISIEVYEHLHPEDGAEHLRQAYSLLKPGGSYVIVTPNAVEGPADITRRVFPEATEPLGFHLNETTNTALIKTLRSIGFRRFRSVLMLSAKVSWLPDVWYPASICCAAEHCFSRLQGNNLVRYVAARFVGITLMAIK
jgi:2-polyprenyl-3-methyl-5-hydroxy-6-metoxy-1,4-benzoquinol methylase